MTAVDLKNIYSTLANHRKYLDGPNFMRLIENTANIIIVKNFRIDSSPQKQLCILIMEKLI